MKFKTPRGFEFEIPDDWWACADMKEFVRGDCMQYPCNATGRVEIVSIADIEPPTRSQGIPFFKKYKLVPILLAFHSPECALPPVTVQKPNALAETRFRYKVHNGFHRYYASIAVGFTSLPVIVIEEIP